jgi:hypothetical protein
MSSQRDQVSCKPGSTGRRVRSYAAADCIEQCPSSRAKRKIYARSHFFSFCRPAQAVRARADPARRGRSLSHREARARPLLWRFLRPVRRLIRPRRVRRTRNLLKSTDWMRSAPKLFTHPRKLLKSKQMRPSSERTLPTPNPLNLRRLFSKFTTQSYYFARVWRSFAVLAGQRREIVE